MQEKQASVVFIREYKNYISAFGKRSREDYLLNVNKIIKDTFKTKFIVPNKVQSFLLNYEIKKLLDKAIGPKNERYSRVIYLNSNLSSSAVLNAMDFIESNYQNLSFSYHIIETTKQEEPPLNIPNLIKITL
jgi:hypothetical protein